MPTPAKDPRLGGSPAHERHMLANLATALFEHRSITTTEHRAKRLRPVVERLITLAKRGDLHARRKVMRTDRKSTRLNSSHVANSYAVFCLKKKTKTDNREQKKEKEKNKNKDQKKRIAQ